MNNKRYLSYSGFCVWGGASTVVYNFFPTAASYVSGTGVITFTFKNHLLTTGDVVNVIDVNGSTFDSNSESVTVIDPNTFTVAVNTGLTGFLDPSIYQNAGSFRIDVPKYSELVINPSLLQVEALPAGTTITIQGKVDPLATWVTLATITDADGLSTVNFNTRYNLVRGNRTVGSGQPTVYAQRT